ncbi:MAG: T9SS type A sorting domain-containing protein [Cyclobacteriaceae bacterium]
MKKFTYLIPLLLIIAYAANGQIELVADLAEGTESQVIELSGEWEENLFVLGDQLLFILEDHPLYGTELWRMGTDEQVSLVTDLLPGPGSGLELTRLALYNERAYFLGTDGQGNHSLYQTDGTEEGTVLIKELYDTEIEGLYYSHVVNNKLLFQISIAEGDQDIWITDGTTGGTEILSAEIDLYHAINIGNQALLKGYDETNGFELWTTDGTAVGTNLLKDINNGSNSSYPTEFYSSSFGVIFRAQTAEEGEEIWVTDGTSLGTELFADINPGAESGQPRNFIEFDNQIFFQAREVGGVSGTELWKSDGTALGTTLVKDIYPGGVGSSVEDFYVFDGALYFSAQGNPTFFELYKSDGTELGTALVKDIHPSGNAFPKAHFEIDGTHYFFAYDNTATGLWTTDGTEVGTTLIKHLYDKSLFPSNIKSSSPPILFNGSYYFNISSQIYKTDGTAVGTVAINHSVDVPKNSDPFNYIETPLGTFFVAFIDGDPHLFITDGTALTDLSEAGFILKGEPGEIDSDFIFYNNKLIFGGYTDTEGGEPWITDGTVVGTQMIKDVNTFDLLGGPGNFFEFNNKVYFGAKNAGSSDFELFVTDGTEAGTALVKDINTGINASNPNGYGIIGSKMYFEANTTTYGTELWESDGTEVNTQQVVDLRAGNPGAVHDIQAYFNDKVFFTAYVDAGIGTELYVSDGTDVGTELLYDIQAGGSSGQIKEGSFVQVGTKLVFAAHDGTLWSTDGTPESTFQILNEAYTATASYRQSIGVINNKYVFVAQDNDDDVYYLFATDGTLENTIVIASDIAYDENYAGNYIYTLPENDNYLFSTELDGKLYFSTGAGIFSTDGTLAGTSYFDTDENEKGFIALFPQTANGNLYFSGFEEGSAVETLFKSDGTAAGTIVLENNGVAVKGPLESIGSYVYFGGYDFEYGTELYRFNTSKEFQTITFNVIEDKFLESETFDLSATASSGLPVSYEIVSGPALVSGNSITLLEVGEVTVAATQAGDGTYFPAEPVEQMFKISLVTGIPEQREPQFKYYPNPVSGTITIIPNGSKNQLTVFDTQGRSLTSGNGNSSEAIQLDLSALPSGIYVLRVANEAGVSQTRILKK